MTLGVVLVTLALKPKLSVALPLCVSRVVLKLSPLAVGVSVAVTGIAGPEAGTKSKPVALVHIAAARTGHETLHERHLFKGSRDAVRAAAVEAALALLIKRLA